jgi:lysozyme
MGPVRLALRAQLIDHEAMRRRLYRCTSGKLTIGVGYNVDDRGLGPMRRALRREVTLAELEQYGLTKAECLALLDADIDVFEADVRARWPNYTALDAVRQRAVIDFVFNLGIAGAAKFANAIRFADMALSTRDVGFQEACWTAVAFHMADSVWARQVDDGLAGRKGRADRLVAMVRTGKDPGVRR